MTMFYLRIWENNCYKDKWWIIYQREYFMYLSKMNENNSKEKKMEGKVKKKKKKKEEFGGITSRLIVWTHEET